MTLSLSHSEGVTLYRMLAESSSDIVLKTDLRGYIVDASPAIRQFGIDDSEALSGRHFLDLVSEGAREPVASAHGAAVAGRERSEWVEFPAITGDQRETWFEIRSSALRDAQGMVYGVLSMMRSIDERRSLKEQLFAATHTDPLTGLTNRGAFVSMLEFMVERDMDGCLALFSIDFFRSINIRYGQHTGDRVLCVFADLLREMLRADDIISRIGSDRFAVLLPRTTPEQAEAICQRVVSTLAEMRPQVDDCEFALTASGSVARIMGTLDSSIERAELALFVAKTKGRNRLEMEHADRRRYAEQPTDRIAEG